MRIVIYDMDGTLLAGSTFTPFLVFAAARLAPLRLALLPVWIAMMLLHKLGLYDRTTLKHRGMRLMLGRPDRQRLEGVAEAFARRRMARLHPGAGRAIGQDQEEGSTVVIATAAFALYADHVGRLLDIDPVIASAWDGGAPGSPNCYGPEKLARVKAWFETLGVDRERAVIRAVSDSFADAPLLDWADEGWLVTSSPRAAARARARGWRPVDFSR